MRVVYEQVLPDIHAAGDVRLSIRADAQARKLADMFRTNIEKFGAQVSAEIKAAGPKG